MVARALHENAGIQQVIIGPEVLARPGLRARRGGSARPAGARRHPAPAPGRRDRPVAGAAQRGPRGRRRRRPLGARRGAAPQRRPHRPADRPRAAAPVRSPRARSSRSSPPRAASARRRCRPTSAPTSRAPASRPCCSTSTSPSATSRSASSWCRSKSIYDAVAMAGSIDEQAIEALVTKHESAACDVICAPNDPGDADRIPVSTITELIKVARRLLRLRHRRHPAVVHRARAGGLRPVRRAHPHRHARHPGGQEPAGSPSTRST